MWKSEINGYKQYEINLRVTAMMYNPNKNQITAYTTKTPKHKI